MNKSIKSKYLSFLLILTILFGNMNTNVFAFSDEDNVNINGYDFSVLFNDSDGVILEYTEDGKSYTFELDRVTSKINITSTEINPRFRYNQDNNYELQLDSDVEYTSTNIDMSGLELLDENTGVSYDLDNDNNKNSRFVFAIPIGVSLLYAAFEALLIVGAAIIIGGVVYTLAEEIYQDLNKQNYYRYYVATLRSGAVWVAGGLSTSQAKALALTNSGTEGVMALSFSYATGLVGRSYRGPENHGSGSGYWYHVHAYGYKAHVWYY